jgi:hypothetical protein
VRSSALTTFNWRDVNVITGHALAATNSGIESYGKALPGVEPNNPAAVPVASRSALRGGAKKLMS